jgi:YD repeat-containing protein
MRLPKSRSCLRILALTSGLLALTPAVASETVTYKYDGRGRLKQVVRSGSVNNGMRSCYVLDKAGNRVRVTVVNGTCPTS